MNPRFPIYIPSKSRASFAHTPRILDRMGVPYRLVVEAEQLDEYSTFFPADRLIVLDPEYQRSYDTCDDLGDSISKGSGPARNFIWDHAISEGHDWHWIMDDNIRYFARLHQNRKHFLGDGSGFHAMETFSLRYTNLAMTGPEYWMFMPARDPAPNPYRPNTRIYSCNLIRNDIPFRWRARYNEDTDLSLRLLKAGWCTVLFQAFLQSKNTTQQQPGGNTEAFYAVEGTLPKSRMIVDLHPDVARLVWRFGRWHHYVDYTPFRDRPLVRRPDYDPATEPRYNLVSRPFDKKPT